MTRGETQTRTRTRTRQIRSKGRLKTGVQPIARMPDARQGARRTPTRAWGETPANGTSTRARRRLLRFARWKRYPQRVQLAIHSLVKEWQLGCSCALPTGMKNPTSEKGNPQ